MKNIHSIEFYTGSKEELLPGFEKDFPYMVVVQVLLEHGKKVQIILFLV